MASKKNRLKELEWKAERSGLTAEEVEELNLLVIADMRKGFGPEYEDAFRLLTPKRNGKEVRHDS